MKKPLTLALDILLVRKYKKQILAANFVGAGLYIAYLALQDWREDREFKRLVAEAESAE